MLLAVCPRVELLSRWRKAFPDGAIVAGLGAAAELPAGTSQLWLHANGADPTALAGQVARLAGLAPSLPLVVISDAPDQALALHALNAGARGCCHALAAPEMLRQVSLVVANGGLWVGPELMLRMLGSVAPDLGPSGAGTRVELSGLTPRERAVALEVSAGATNKEAARALGITERTVKAHLAQVFAKLGVRDRLELVIALHDGASSAARGVARRAGPVHQSNVFS